MEATDSNGRLRTISNCYLQVGALKIPFNNLPDLSDSKSASYNSESVIGRASPIKTYAGSDDRSIGLTIELFVQDKDDPKKNLRILRTCQSAVYPRQQGQQYFPPVVCRLKVGSLLSNEVLCCAMRSCQARFPKDVPWDDETLCPYRLEISMDFDVVYASANLPGYELILQDYPS